MMNNVNDLRELMRSRGLEKLVPHAEKLSAPSIRLLLTPEPEPYSYSMDSVSLTYTPQDQTPIGVSKVGGFPDLPPDFSWPEIEGVALPFLAQFRLEEIAPFDLEGDLPHSGMLYFFYADSDLLEHCCHVFYFDGDLNTLVRRDFPPNIKRHNFQGISSPFDLPFQTPETIRFYRELDVANADCLEFYLLAEELNLTDVERYGLWQQLSVDWSNEQEATEHQLLGLPFCSTYDAREVIAEEESEQWRLLFQFPNEYPVSFFIHREALKQRNFSEIRASWNG